MGRFEQLSNDMAKIVDRLGLAKAELPHLNKSPRSPCILGAGDARDQSRPSLDGMGVGRRLRRRPFSPASCLRALNAEYLCTSDGRGGGRGQAKHRPRPRHSAPEQRN